MEHVAFVRMDEEQRLEISVGSQRYERGLADSEVTAPEDSGELSERRCEQERRRRQLTRRPAAMSGSCHQLGGHDGIPAEREVVVVETDVRNLEKFGPKRGEFALER